MPKAAGASETSRLAKGPPPQFPATRSGQKLGRAQIRKRHKMDFSIQLYSGRNFPPMDALIERIAKLGYTQVEGFGGLYADADNLAKSLKANGLTMPTGHFGLTQLQDTS